MPVKNLRSLGATSGWGYGPDPGPAGRTTFTASDGTTLVLVPDVTAGTVDADKILLYELSGSSKGTKTLLATIDAPSTDWYGGWTAAIFPDDSIALLAKSADKISVRYCKIRSSDWTQLAWEVVNNHSGSFRAECMDIDVSDSGAVFVCWNQSGPTDVHSRIKVRDTGGTWHAVRDAVISENPNRKSCEAVSIVTLDEAAADVRNVAFLHGVGTSGVDTGIILYTCGVDETDGTIVDAVATRGTFMSSEADAASNNANSQRNAKLFRGDGNEFLFAAMHRAVAKRIGIMKASYDAGSWAVIRSLVTSSLGFDTIGTQMGITARHDTAAADSHTVNFYARGKISDTSDTAFDVIAKVTNTAVTYSGPFKYGIPPSSEMSTYTIKMMGGSGSRNLDLAKHEILALYNGSVAAGGGALDSNRAYMIYGDVQPNGSSAILVTSPTTGDTVSSSNPDLIAYVDDGQKYAQSRQKIQFQFDNNSDFSSLVADYIQPDSKFKLVEGTDTGGVVVTFNDTLPNTFTLSGGTYYMRARMRDEWGNLGVWTSTKTIDVSHPPTALPLYPSNGLFKNYGDGNVTFTWGMTDPSAGDTQTAYQIQLYTADDVLIFDTNKVTDTDQSHTAFIDDEHKNTLLYWVLKLWDSNDDPSQFSIPAFFTLSDPPSAVVESPVNGSTVATGMPTLMVSIVTSGGRKVKEVIFSITKGGVPIWSIKKTGLWEDEDTVSTQVPQNYLQNNTSYSFQATVLDTTGLLGTSNLVSFDVEWVPPDAPTAIFVDETPYGMEEYDSEPGGYVHVEWSEDSDANFFSWNLYRKDDLIDPNTLAVVEEGEYKLIYRHYEEQALITYKDYFAPSGYKVTYMLRQQVNVEGQDIESEDGATDNGFPNSDGYWIIFDSNEAGEADLFKFNVNEDSFTEEQEEAEFTVIGRGRVNNRGQNLGPKGSLTVKIRSGGTRSARQKRLILLEAQKTKRKVWLRNPFGDVFRVSVSQMQVSRIAGVGKEEFVDVQIPYSQVAST